MLDLLLLADAIALLTELIGERAAADPYAAALLAGCCCRLPLALRIAAELATARPRVPLAVLAAELEQRQRRLDLLEAGGDSATAVREVFSWSVRHLDPATARGFALAALHPGTDLDASALAALAGARPRASRADAAGAGPGPPGPARRQRPATACMTCCAPTAANWPRQNAARPWNMRH